VDTARPQRKSATGETKEQLDKRSGKRNVESRAALNYSARRYDSAVCCSKMSCDAFLSEALYEADKALEKFAAARRSMHVYKMVDEADGESQMYVLFCYFA